MTGATGSGRIIIGLFGKAAPESVKRFLSVIDGDSVNTPSFINSQFTRVVGGDLLEMEKVRGINKVSIAGKRTYHLNIPTQSNITAHPLPSLLHLLHRH